MPHSIVVRYTFREDVDTAFATEREALQVSQRTVAADSAARRTVALCPGNRRPNRATIDRAILASLPCLRLLGREEKVVDVPDALSAVEDEVHVLHTVDAGPVNAGV